MTTTYAKVETLPDGGQVITVWDVSSDLKTRIIDAVMGEPSSTNLLGLEQVVRAREGVGTFGSIPGGLPA
jgi:hypothetical protein